LDQSDHSLPKQTSRKAHLPRRKKSLQRAGRPPQAFSQRLKIKIDRGLEKQDGFSNSYRPGPGDFLTRSPSIAPGMPQERKNSNCGRKDWENPV